MQRDNIRVGKAVSMIVIEYGIIAAAIALSLYAQNIIVYIIAIFVIGNRMEIIDEVVNHQALHLTLFPRKQANRTDILFLPFFTTFASYLNIHMNHHAFVGKEKDPHYTLSRDIYQIIEHTHKTETKSQRIYMHFIRPLIGGFFFGTLKYTLQQCNFITNRNKDTLKVGVFWIALFALAVYVGIRQEVLLYRIVPFLYTRPIFFYRTALAQHFDRGNYVTYNFDGFIGKYILSCYGEHLHAVHHENMQIPAYQLKAHINPAHTTRRIHTLKDIWNVFLLAPIDDSLYL